MNTATKRQQMYERIRKHGEQLLAIFPDAVERDPVKLCKQLRSLEHRAARLAVDHCNGDIDGEEYERLSELMLKRVNALLGNRHEYQPKTGAKCGCRRGVECDNCPTCEGTGRVIDFNAIRNRKPLVPVFFNGDPRGYTLKIRDEYAREHQLKIHRDWGGYGIIAPDLSEES